MIVFMRYFFLHLRQCQESSHPLVPSHFYLPVRESFSPFGCLTISQSANQLIVWLQFRISSRCFQCFKTIFSFPLFPPGISSLRPARGPHLSSARPPRATPWRRGRFTPRRRVLCQGTACPGGRSSSRSHPNTAPGSALP